MATRSTTRRHFLQTCVALAGVALPLLSACGGATTVSTSASSAGAGGSASASVATAASASSAPASSAATSSAAAGSSAAAQPAGNVASTWYFNQRAYWSVTRDGGLGMYMGDLINAGLLSADEKNNPIPAAAESWKQSDDGLTWTFNLRKDLKFAPTGRPLKAIDVKHSFELQLANMATWDAPTYFFFVKGATDAATQAQKATKPGDVAKPIDIPGFVAADDYTFQVQLSAPAPALLPYAAAGALSSWTIGDPEQMAKDTPDKRWNANGGGSIGPYMIKSYDDTTGNTVLVPNPYYVLGTPPPLSQITITYIKDAQTMLIGYQNNDADFMYSVASADAKQINSPSHQLHNELHLRAAANFYWWGFNLGKEPFNDPNMRKAVALSIDWQKVHDSLYGTLATMPTSIIPTGTFHQTDLFPKYYKYDPAGAKDAFKSSKYAGDVKKLPTIQMFATAGNNDQITWAQVIQQMVKDTLGVTMGLVTKDSLTTQDRPNMDIIPESWGTATVDPSEWTYQLTTPDPSVVNFGFPQDKTKSDAWVKAINTDTNEANRKKAYADGELEVASNYLILPDRYTPFISLEKPYLKNLYTAPSWYWIKTNLISVNKQ